MSSNIKDYFRDTRLDHKWNKKPILLKWLDIPGMSESIEVIDSKIGNLLTQNARRKLRQWLLSDDRDFNNVTTERYAVDFLKTKNPNMIDNIFDSQTIGTDAELNQGKEKIGLEVTTINGFIADWIFCERLPLYLNEKVG